MFSVPLPVGSPGSWVAWPAVQDGRSEVRTELHAGPQGAGRSEQPYSWASTPGRSASV